MKKGSSQIIAAVLLIGITITLASIILLWGNLFLITLSPPNDCDETNFRTLIFEENSKQFLDISNSGEPLYGVRVEELNEGSNTKLAEFIYEAPINPGYTYNSELPPTTNEKFLIIPTIKSEDNEALVVCSSEYGIEIDN